MFQIGKMFFVIKKVKNTVPWTYAIEDLYGKNCYKFLQKNIPKDKSQRL